MSPLTKNWNWGKVRYSNSTLYLEKEGTMKKWEYYSKLFKELDEFGKPLNECGQLGWELVNVVYRGTNLFPYEAFFKREIVG